MPLSDRLVLCYHAISERWDAALSLEPARLERQLAEVVARGYVGATFTEAVMQRRARLTLAVTFDDGFRSVFECALPILARHGLVGTVFVPTGYIAREAKLDWPVLDAWMGGPHERELEPMSWSDVQKLAAAGWEIGSHTVSHPNLARLSDERLAQELSDSRRECEERLGQPCRSIAYPYGAVDRRVMGAARRAGYEAAAALPPRIHRPHRYRWPRVGIWRRDPLRVFQAKLSPLTRRRLDLPTGATTPCPRWRFSDP
jgi:peptidoglycan/xylan/chitin deacetylase (PgdA/CDA1 family)